MKSSLKRPLCGWKIKLNQWFHKTRLVMSFLRLWHEKSSLRWHRDGILSSLLLAQGRGDGVALAAPHCCLSFSDAVSPYPLLPLSLCSSTALPCSLLVGVSTVLSTATLTHTGTLDLLGSQLPGHKHKKQRITDNGVLWNTWLAGLRLPCSTPKASRTNPGAAWDCTRRQMFG